MEYRPFYIPERHPLETTETKLSKKERFLLIAAEKVFSTKISEVNPKEGINFLLSCGVILGALGVAAISGVILHVLQNEHNHSSKSDN